MKNNKPIIYFHIGQPKTGTSAIQSFLNFNRQVLASKYDTLYPNFDENNLSSGTHHNHFSLFTKPGVRSKNYTSNLIKQFERCIDYSQKNGIEKIIISNEGFFWHWWPAVIKKIVDHLNVDYKIICYLRRQDYWIESAWKQWGHKITNLESIHDYLKTMDLDWHKALKPWSFELGHENIIIRAYEKGQIESDIIKDFIGLIGIKHEADLKDAPINNLNSNTGFNRDVIELLRICNGLVTNEHDHSLLDFMDQMLSDKFKNHPLKKTNGFLSPEIRTSIIQKYSESNSAIAREYLNRDDGKLFFEPLPHNNQNWIPHDKQTIEMVLPIIMEIMVKQQKMIKELQKKISK